MPIDAPSHFSMVGFPVAMGSEAAMIRSFDPLIDRCERTPVSGGDELCTVIDPSGGEMRIGLRPESDRRVTFITANPAFAGEGRTRVKIDAVVPDADPAFGKYEIRVSAKFDGEDTPVIFELADPRQATLFKPGATLEVDIAAFSYDATAHADSAAYYKTQEKPDVTVRFADNFFIPTGMFSAEAGGKGTAAGPGAYADFAGTVIKSDLRTNAVGGGKFRWVLVRTYGGATIDVVLDPATIQGEIKPGMILSGSFWMSGRLATRR